MPRRAPAVVTATACLAVFAGGVRFVVEAFELDSLPAAHQLIISALELAPLSGLPGWPQRGQRFGTAGSEFRPCRGVVNPANANGPSPRKPSSISFPLTRPSGNRRQF